MVAAIGIKIANGEFYPIIDENSSVKKRLVLTTVHDKQHSVQIDLYKSFTKTMADSLYIGSLVVEDLGSKPKGEPSIEMIISCDAEGHISAEALDLDTTSGAHHQYLNVSLKSLDDRDIELPDFELEQHEKSQGLYERASAVKENEGKKPGRRLWPLLILLGVLLLALCLGLYFFLVHGKSTWGTDQNGTPAIQSAQPEFQAPIPPAEQAQPAQPAAPPAEAAPAEPVAPPAEPVAPAAPPPAPSPPPLIQAPAQAAPAPVVSRSRNPPVASYKVPATIPRNGVAYRIRWGDTLWDIAEAFYRNPW
ncbi:MAG: Hsp70 family protein, partial [Treponema sp.]|nr:Hsp70 family protein [Treponema sp.]